MNKMLHFTLSKNRLQKKELISVDELTLIPETLNWIHVQSLKDKDIILDLMSQFKVSQNVVDDIFNENAVPKLDSYQDYLYMLLESIELNEHDSIEPSQLSILVFENTLISIEDERSQMVEDILQDIEDKKAFSELSLEYILYMLIDRTIEESFEVLETIGERIDEIEDDLLVNPEESVLENIYALKKTLVTLRKTLWPTRNAVNKLFRSNGKLMDLSNTNFMHDIFDRLIQLIDLTETYRDICSGMLDIYLSSISNKTNDIMKILTIYSTIFIPLSFLAGVYGMNFKYLPELQWKYSYLVFWIISVGLTMGMLRFFKKKKWI